MNPKDKAADAAATAWTIFREGRGRGPRPQPARERARAEELLDEAERLKGKATRNDEIRRVTTGLGPTGRDQLEDANVRHGGERAGDAFVKSRATGDQGLGRTSEPVELGPGRGQGDAARGRPRHAGGGRRARPARRPRRHPAGPVPAAHGRQPARHRADDHEPRPRDRRDGRHPTPRRRSPRARRSPSRRSSSTRSTSRFARSRRSCR